MTDELDPLRDLRPDRDEYAEPNDPSALARERDRLMSVIEPEQTQPTWKHMPSIYPRLAYEDEVAALEFLTRAFGFVERRESRMDADEEWGMLAWLEYGDGIVMIGRAEHDIHGLYAPHETTHPSCMINGAVDNVDAHYERARAAGAAITSAPENTDFGSRDYHATDLEGHPWTFGTYRPDAGGS